MVRIGIIEDTLLHGGTQMWSVEAARFFSRHGAEVTVITPEGGWVAEQFAGGSVGVQSYDYEGVASGKESVSEAWTAGLARCDVVLCTVHPPRGSFHAATYARGCIERAGLPTLLIPKTGTIVPSYRREFYRPNKEISPCVIATTAFTRDYLIEHYGIPQGEVALIYQGIDLSRFVPGPRTGDRVLQRAGPMLGCIGSFERRKGQAILLQALARIRVDLPGVQLLLIGDGPDESILREAVKEQDLADSVTLVPFTEHPERILSRLDILVLPSLYKEGLPNVILEAMATGVPVVSSRLAGIPEAVSDGETGVLVPPGDVRALSEAIVSLWSDPGRYARLRENAIARVVEKFDRRRRLEDYLRFIEGLM